MPTEMLFESKLYRLRPNQSIEMLVGVGRSGTMPGLPPPTTFLGHATVTGIVRNSSVLPTGESFSRKVSFDIPASDIFEAADLFNAMLAKEVARMNKPRIVG